jgi:two-component system chemotaxis sensor kinase CheA
VNPSFFNPSPRFYAVLPDGFAPGEFLEGFLEESGEHLQSINRNLLRLEELVERQDLDSHAEAMAAVAIERVELLNTLFRSFHTLKGLSGMVGLTDASRLSHAMEAVLSSLQREEYALTTMVVDALLQGTNALAEVIDARRSAEINAADVSSPDITVPLRVLDRLRESGSITVAEEDAAETSPVDVDSPGGVQLDETLPGLGAYPEVVKSLGDLERQKLLAAARAGETINVAVFRSSVERATRGENVDQVRQQIVQVGSLIKAIPAMRNGAIHFLFLFSTKKPVEEGAIVADEVAQLALQLPEPAQPARPTDRATVRAAGSSPVVRVDLERLDELMRYAGELITLRARLGANLAQLEGVPGPLKRELTNTYQQFGRSLRDLRRAILHARMVPLAETFKRMPLVARDLARASQKEVRLVIQGETTEVDKLLVERILDPLIHLVRNAITHGIETPEERTALGKPARGRIVLCGIPEGDHIRIEVSDDGRGLDLNRVAEKAAALGWLPPGSAISTDEALEFITRPGFSTRDRADLSAGRGVGLDVVRRMVSAFGGKLSMVTEAERGTTFQMRLPLTLVVVDALFVRAGKQQFAVQRDDVERIIEIDPSAVVTAESGMLLQAGQDYFVLHPLADLLRVPAAGGRSHAAGGRSHEAGGRSHAAGGRSPTGRWLGLVARADDEAHRAAGGARPVLVVDAVMDLQEVVVHTLADPLVARPGVDGATEQGDGSVVLILDIPALLRQAGRG